MNHNRVPRRRLFFGGALGSLGILLLMSGSTVTAQEWQANPDPASVADSTPTIPLPFQPPLRKAEPVSMRTEEAVNENLAAIEAEQLPAGTPKYTLEECIRIALEKQPALAAAGASLGAAQQAYRGVAALPMWAGLVSRDLAIRRLQACLGITAAQAGLTQAEWDTRYAVTRNYFSVVYARMQSKQVQRIVDKLARAHEKGQKLIDSAIGNINQIDVNTIYLAKEKTRAKGLEAAFGVRKALDALHEAMGLSCDYPLDIVDDVLPPLVSELDVKEMIALALSGRGELTQAQILAQIMDLEICAQSKVCFRPRTLTFAAGADIHATQIPQGVANGEYRPGAIPPEYPTNFVGPRYIRMERAQFFSARASAVVDKTENLITLETKIAYWKWKEAAERIRIYLGDPKSNPNAHPKMDPKSRNEPPLAAVADKIFKSTFDRFEQGKATGEEYLKAQGVADVTIIEINEAFYNHALGLIALERITAGGYRVFPQMP